jgi:hypothetical protein
MRKPKPVSDLEREVFDLVNAGKLKMWEAGKRLGVSASSVNNRMVRLHWKEKKMPPAENKIDHAQQPAPIAIPKTSLPSSLEELMRGPSPGPATSPEVTATSTESKPSADPTPGASPTSTTTQTTEARPQEIDQAAARMAKKIILKFRAGILRSAIRYFGISPTDPDVLELLPRDMQNDGPKGGPSFLEMILDENQDKTQKVGKLFRGWLGMGLGTVIEGFEMVGTVRAIAEKKGILLPEEQQAERDQAERLARAKEEAAGRGQQADVPKQSNVFDLGAALGKANSKGGL